MLSLSFFFFSRRRGHTICSGDWISAVCSSDLVSWGGPRRDAPPLPLPWAPGALGMRRPAGRGCRDDSGYSSDAPAWRRRRGSRVWRRPGCPGGGHRQFGVDGRYYRSSSRRALTPGTPRVRSAARVLVLASGALPNRVTTPLSERTLMSASL